MSYKHFYKSFQKFIDDDNHLTEEEQQIALEKFKDPHYKKIFRVALILLIWAFVGLFIDTVVIGGSGVAIFSNGFKFIYLLPTIIFTGINWMAKSLFAYYYLNKKIPKMQAFWAGAQYVGPGLLLSYLLRTDPHFKHTLFHYMKWLKKKGFAFIWSLFQKK